MSRLFFTSDLHFGHEAVIEYCKRPYMDLTHMHESLIYRWNLMVKPTDTIIVAGDLALCSFKEFEPIAARLQGNKILVKGNHDRFSESQYNRLGFTVYHELKIKLAGHMLRISHYPYALPWYKRLFAFKSELRYMDRRPPRIPGETLIHGHTHTTYKGTNDGRIHVGVDAWGYGPASDRDIEAILNRKSRS